MKVAIVGSREYPNMDVVKEYIASLPMDTVVVTGGWPSLAGGYHVVEATPGVDRTAYTAAEKHGLVTVLVAGSKTMRGHLAGIQRNPYIVELCDSLVAFWDQKSHGTARTVALAWKAKKYAYVVGVDGQQLVQPDAFIQSVLR